MSSHARLDIRTDDTEQPPVRGSDCGTVRAAAQCVGQAHHGLKMISVSRS